MAGEVTDSGAPVSTARWREVDELLAATAAAARSPGDDQAFYTVLIRRSLQALDAASGAVWRLQADGSPTRVCTHNIGESESVASIDEWLITWMARQGSPGVLRAQARVAADVLNPLDSALVFGAIMDDDARPLAVVALALPTEMAVSAHDATLEVFTAFCELAADYERRNALRKLQRQRRLQQALEDFAVAIQRPADVEATAYAIVNEGRRIVGCDRVSLVTIRRQQPRTRAVSGVDVLERRGATLRMLETLAQGIARNGEPIHLHRDQSVGAEDLLEVAESYRDVSLARRLDALPLFGPPSLDEQPRRVLAMLFLEWFTAGADANDVEDTTIGAVQRLSESSLANALTRDAIPWAAAWRRVDNWLSSRAERRNFRALAIVLTVCGLVLLGIFIPAELTVSARGRLQPVVRRAIFAPSDGVVAEVLVDHGERVEANQLLLRMENAALALETARLTGELATAEQQLRSVRAERWSESPNREQLPQDAGQLAAQEESLMALVTSLTAQRQIAVQQESELEVTSPIKGSVVTWRVSELLRARPVARGQELLTVADETGDWFLELDVPDRQIRQILQAQAASEAQLEVPFRLSTDPATTHVGRLRKVAGATQPIEGAQLAVPVEVDFDKQQVANLRPGVEVTARIRCGRRSIAYVWLHEIWEWMAARIW